jgi:hypothetical protein
VRFVDVAPDTDDVDITIMTVFIAAATPPQPSAGAVFAEMRDVLNPELYFDFATSPSGLSLDVTTMRMRCQDGDFRAACDDGTGLGHPAPDGFSWWIIVFVIGIVGLGALLFRTALKHRRKVVDHKVARNKAAKAEAKKKNKDDTVSRFSSDESTLGQLQSHNRAAPSLGLALSVPMVVSESDAGDAPSMISESGESDTDDDVYHVDDYDDDDDDALPAPSLADALTSTSHVKVENTIFATAVGKQSDRISVPLELPRALAAASHVRAWQESPTKMAKLPSLSASASTPQLALLTSSEAWEQTSLSHAPSLLSPATTAPDINAMPFVNKAARAKKDMVPVSLPLSMSRTATASSLPSASSAPDINTMPFVNQAARAKKGMVPVSLPSSLSRTPMKQTSVVTAMSPPLRLENLSGNTSGETLTPVTVRKHIVVRKRTAAKLVSSKATAATAAMKAIKVGEESPAIHLRARLPTQAPSTALVYDSNSDDDDADAAEPPVFDYHAAHLDVPSPHESMMSHESSLQLDLSSDDDANADGDGDGAATRSPVQISTPRGSFIIDTPPRGSVTTLADRLANDIAVATPLRRRSSLTLLSNMPGHHNNDALGSTPPPPTVPRLGSVNDDALRLSERESSLHGPLGNVRLSNEASLRSNDGSRHELSAAAPAYGRLGMVRAPSGREDSVRSRNGGTAEREMSGQEREESLQWDESFVPFVSQRARRSRISREVSREISETDGGGAGYKIASMLENANTTTTVTVLRRLSIVDSSEGGVSIASFHSRSDDDSDDGGDSDGGDSHSGDPRDKGYGGRSGSYNGGGGSGGGGDSGGSGRDSRGTYIAAVTAARYDAAGADNAAADRSAAPRHLRVNSGGVNGGAMLARVSPRGVGRYLHATPNVHRSVGNDDLLPRPSTAPRPLTHNRNSTGMLPFPASAASLAPLTNVQTTKRPGTSAGLSSQGLQRRRDNQNSAFLGMRVDATNSGGDTARTYSPLGLTANIGGGGGSSGGARHELTRNALKLTSTVSVRSSHQVPSPVSAHTRTPPARLSPHQSPRQLPGNLPTLRGGGDGGGGVGSEETYHQMLQRQGFNVAHYDNPRGGGSGVSSANSSAWQSPALLPRDLVDDDDDDDDVSGGGSSLVRCHTSPLMFPRQLSLQPATHDVDIESSEDDDGDAEYM